MLVNYPRVFSQKLQSDAKTLTFTACFHRIGTARTASRNQERQKVIHHTKTRELLVLEHPGAKRIDQGALCNWLCQIGIESCFRGSG